MKTKLMLDNVAFSFGSVAAIKGISLTVEEGCFMTFLGPSGCGKTTLLRLISGFLVPNSGSVLIDGVDQKGREVNERKVGMVFQDYALFPHMTVMQNLLYGLKIGANTQSVPKEKKSDYCKEMVHETADALGIGDLLLRFPHELSGGQQQRVALGRALVLKPELLLMDEPLSSLDTKLRTKVREELKEIQQKLGITTIYVTHDQEEALSLSTQIAVLNEGTVQQVGSPEELYFRPQNTFTADFIGKANFIEKNGATVVVRPEWLVPVSVSGGCSGERIPVPADEILLTGTVVSATFLGGRTRFVLRTDTAGSVTADFDTLSGRNIHCGDVITVRAAAYWKL